MREAGEFRELCRIAQQQQQGENGTAARTSPDLSQAPHQPNNNNNGNLPPPPQSFTPETETFIQIIAASMQGEKKLLAKTLKGDKWYYVVREICRFDEMRRGEDVSDGDRGALEDSESEEEEEEDDDHDNESRLSDTSASSLSRTTDGAEDGFSASATSSEKQHGKSHKKKNKHHKREKKLLKKERRHGKREEKRLKRKLTKEKLATKEDFEKYRDHLLSEIPNSVKNRFREGGFSRWGKDWLPCLELGPFDVEPGPVRDMWIDMYNNVSVFCFLSVLSLHRLDRLESFILLSAFTTFTTKLSINYSFQLKTRLVSMDAKCHVSSFGTVSNLRREAKPTASCPAAN